MRADSSALGSPSATLPLLHALFDEAYSLAAASTASKGTVTRQTADATANSMRTRIFRGNVSIEHLLETFERTGAHQDALPA